MKCLSVILTLLLLSLRMQGQVSMTVQLPPTGVLQKAQLWNILLVSAAPNIVTVRVVLRLSDAQTGQPVLTGVSRQILLRKGAKQLQAGDVTPVEYEYLSPAVDRSANGLLTAGNYLACYSVVVQDDDKSNMASEDCIPFAVEPVSPPLLNMPPDKSVQESFLPQFSWLPPSPLTVFNDLNYDMVVAELRPGQSPAEAVQQNIPVFRSMHNRSLFINYPSSAPALDTGKQYAWTVRANNGLRFAAQTEVWTFRIRGPQVKQVVTNDAYVQLKKELDGSATTCTGVLQCLYNNEAGDSLARYEIIALEGGNEVRKTGTVQLQPGSNLLQLRVGKLSDRKSYLFRLYNSRQERWHMKFIYSDTEQQ